MWQSESKQREENRMNSSENGLTYILWKHHVFIMCKKHIKNIPYLSTIGKLDFFGKTQIDKDCLGNACFVHTKMQMKDWKDHVFLHCEALGFLYRIGIIDSLPKLMQMPLTSLLGLQTLTFCCWKPCFILLHEQWTECLTSHTHVIQKAIRQCLGEQRTGKWSQCSQR